MAPGLILSILMCKAMNRSILNVLFGAFGQVTLHRRAVCGYLCGFRWKPTVKKITFEEAAALSKRQNR
jgi:NAD/NADP transhydrogenase beta subunit